MPKMSNPSQYQFSMDDLYWEDDGNWQPNVPSTRIVQRQEEEYQRVRKALGLAVKEPGPVHRAYCWEAYLPGGVAGTRVTGRIETSDPGESEAAVKQRAFEQFMGKAEFEWASPGTLSAYYWIKGERTHLGYFPSGGLVGTNIYLPEARNRLRQYLVLTMVTDRERQNELERVQWQGASADLEIRDEIPEMVEKLQALGGDEVGQIGGQVLALDLAMDPDIADQGEEMTW